MHAALIKLRSNTKTWAFYAFMVLNLLVSASYALVDGVKITGDTIVDLPRQDKKVTMQTIRLSPKFKQKFKQKLLEIQAENHNTENLSFSNHYEGRQFKNFDVDLGMGNVPVLDQGLYGTCATFSTTAALDAYKNAGDYISQQCLLEIGNYEEAISNYNIPSGWDGAFFEDVLNRINKYGVIDKKSCPHQYANRSFKLTPREYLDYSFNAQWAYDFQWQPLNSYDEEGYEAPASIEEVKQALNKGHRVLIGTLLIMRYADGLPINGKKSGFWDFPTDYTVKQFLYDINHEGIVGHAIIVTGYNDKDRVFKIRNSWGEKSGDAGEFYMSYDYFEAMNIDTVELY